MRRFILALRSRLAAELTGAASRPREGAPRPPDAVSWSPAVAPHQLLSRCAKLFGRQWNLFVGIAFCMLLLGLLQLPGPILTMKVIDAINQSGGPLSIRSINLMCAALVLTLLSARLVGILQRYFLEKFRYRVTFSLQRNLFSHSMKLPMSHHLRHPHGYMMSRVNEDPYRVQGLLADTVISILGDLITLSVGVGFLFYVHWRLALASVAVLPIMVVLFTRLRTSLKDDFKESQEKSAQVNKFLAESLANVFSIKVLTLEAQSRKRFVEVLGKLIRQRFHILRRRLTYENTIGTLSGLVPIAILWYGAFEIVAGRLSVGEFIAFNGFLAYLYRPAEGIVIALLSMQGSIAAIERVFEILDTRAEPYGPASGNSHQAPLVPLGASPAPVAVEFQDVSFRYPGKQEWILKGASFSVGRGDFVAVTGVSGVGKTTLLNLIGRFLELDEGRILIEGVDHRSIPLLELRRVCTVVSQETRLFSTTILENLRYGCARAGTEAVLEALRIAGADDFVARLPAGLDTPLDETGQNLSAGQRQRLLIARAVLRRPSILILDEATAFLDAELETEVLANLRRAMAGRTVIAVSHRASILDFADRSLVVKGSGIEEAASTACPWPLLVSEETLPRVETMPS